MIDTPDLIQDSRFGTNKGRVENQDALRPLLAEQLRGHPRQHWLEQLKKKGVPCGAVRDLAEVLSDPQLQARMMVLPMTHPSAGAIQVLGVPVKLADSSGGVRIPPPVLGQHTHALLEELGYSQTQVDSLREAAVV